MRSQDARLTRGHAGPGIDVDHRPLERLVVFLLTRTPLGRLVHWVAGVRASIHTKLLTAFLVIAALFIATGAMSVLTVRSVSHQSRLLDEAHKRVDLSRQLEHALAMQISNTAMALIIRNERSIAQVLRENNRFNDKLAQIEAAAPPVEPQIIGGIRAAQDQLLTAVADLANLIRDGKTEEAMRIHLERGRPLYAEIEALVHQIVTAKYNEMTQLRDIVDSATRRAMLHIGVLVCVAIILALTLGFVISWSLILPVREADAFLSRVAKGEFTTTVNVRNRDEFGALSAHMNQMARDLHRLYDEQRQAAQKLRELNRQLESASKAKSDFLANMSHELRTPLNAILGFTELILDGSYGEVSPDVQERIGDISTCGRQLLRLINDVLDLSKIEAGRMELRLEPYAAAELVGTVMLSLRSLAEEKGLEFVSDVPEDLPIAIGDSKRIAQCLTNLAGNALKFTKEGTVRVAVEADADALVFRVTDTGIGIAADQVDHLFEEFRQADPTIAQEFGGTGLGLSITKEFVEMHGGRIWVESEEGRGSMFAFSLPLEPVVGD